MDSVEYIERAKQKIFELGSKLIKRVGHTNVCRLVDSIYELDESINIVSDSLTPADCIELTICNLVEKYCLEDVVFNAGEGIDNMSIDDSNTCNIFTVYL